MSEKISYRKESVLLLLVLSILPYPWLFFYFAVKVVKNAEESIASQRSLLLQTQNNQQKTTVI